MFSEDCFSESLLAILEAVVVFVGFIVGYFLIQVFSHRSQAQEDDPDVGAADLMGIVTSVSQGVAPPMDRCMSPIDKWTRLRHAGAANPLQIKLHEPAQIKVAGLPMTIPTDVASSLANFVGIADLSQLGASSRSALDSFWQPRQVWTDLFVARGLEPTSVSADRFRQMFFCINDDRPGELLRQARKGTGGPAEILEEAAHMLRGLMPNDGHFVMDCVLEAAAAAIWSHDVSDERAVRAVNCFLQVVRRRQDLLPPCQVEGLALSAAWKVNAMSPASPCCSHEGRSN